MYMKLSFLLIYLIKFLKGSKIDNLPCQQSSPCTCQYPNNLVIDISRIKVPVFGFYSTPNVTTVFMYNPCEDVPSTIQNVTELGALWVFKFNISKNDDVHFDSNFLHNETIIKSMLGYTLEHAASANWTHTEYHSSESPIIEYKNMSIILECTEKGSNTSFADYNISPTDKIKLTLRSPFVCATDYADEPSERSYSTGTVLVVIFFSFALFYFIVGGLVLKYLRGAEGWEMVPNHEFWMELPSLVRDGFLFAISCGTTRPNTYERI